MIQKHQRSPSASLEPSAHARHVLPSGPPYSLDSALHLSRYEWAVAQAIDADDIVVDLGCGSGFGSRLIASLAKQVIGVDFDPHTARLNNVGEEVNLAFIVDDVTIPGLKERLVPDTTASVLSMETVEHLEDYFTYLENICEIVGSDKTFVLGTPNRTMTYNRYPGRRHMDESHVQEFTPRSLEFVLRSYFSSVELFLQVVPNHWSNPAGPIATAQSYPASLSGAARRYLPPVAIDFLRRIRKRYGRLGSSATERYLTEDIDFLPLENNPELVLDAFALLAICRYPKASREANQVRSEYWGR